MLSWLSAKIYAAQSAEQLMFKFASTGKTELLNALVNRHGDDLHHYLLSMADPSLAQDLAQSAWLKVIEKKHLFANSIKGDVKNDNQANFKAWLFTLARNLFIDQYRANKGNVSLEQNPEQQLKLDSQTVVGAAKQLEDMQAIEQFNQLLSTLPWQQKEAFMLQQEGFSVAQIATITEQNHQTIKSRLRYARDHFKPLSTQLKEDA